MRLLGLSVSGLADGGARQLTLDEAERGPGWERASRTVDEIRARFGRGAIGPAVLGGPDGVESKGGHRHQWGPSGGRTGAAPHEDTDDAAGRGGGGA